MDEVILGDNTQTADILTRGRTPDQIRMLADSPTQAVNQLALIAGRPPPS